VKRSVAFIASLLVASGASADVENDLGFGTRAASMGNAVSALGGDAASVVYNPGALVLGTDRDGFADLEANVVIAAPALWVESLGDDPIDVASVGNTYAIALAARFDIGNALGAPGLALGFALYTPFEGLVGSEIRPDDSPSWLMLGDRTQHIAIWAGLAYRIAPWLSVGAGVRIIFDEETFITGRAEDIARVTDPETGIERVEAGARLGISASIYGHVAPTAGFLLAATPHLRFAFAWRGELVSDDWGWSRLQGIESVGDIGFLHRFTHVLRPNELVWSASYAPIPEIEIATELTWAMWSAARSPTYAELGARFGDVVVPSIGARFTVHPGVDLSAGYRYMARPYDDLGGPTNLLSANMHSASIGIAVDLDRLIEDGEVPFTISLASRLSILEDREEVKNGRRFPNDRALLENPGYPGYRYGGVIPSVQLGVEASW
jgi:hypothetical protein